MRGVPWFTPATTNTWVLDIFLTMIILMVQKKIVLRGERRSLLLQVGGLVQHGIPHGSRHGQRQVQAFASPFSSWRMPATLDIHC
jgi:hypothetical protein